MFIADLKGKLTIHEEVSEDFLTSVVFIMLQQEFVLPLLQENICLLSV